ncbi:hypothetical protein VUR80DRAFT_9172 [Thermomyces stellatus]
MGGRGEDWRFSLRHRSTWRLHVSRDRLDGRPLRGPYFCPREEGEQPTIAAVNGERRTAAAKGASQWCVISDLDYERGPFSPITLFNIRSPPGKSTGLESQFKPRGALSCLLRVCLHRRLDFSQ